MDRGDDTISDDIVDIEALHASAGFFRGKGTGAKAGKAPVGSEVRLTLVATLLKILVKDKEQYAKAVAGGEESYFRSRFLGNVQYLVWWISAWYPAQVVERLPGSAEVRLHLKGFNRFFEKAIRLDDSRLRRQLVLLNTEEHLTCGYFPAKGDYVKVFLVDDFEAPYFLCQECFEGGSSERTSSSNEALWEPIGKVIKCLPLKDQAEIEIHSLACTEVVRVCNAHILPISEKEYKEGTQRIMHCRAQGLSYVERQLCKLGEVRLLIRSCCVISHQTCLVTSWDCFHHIRVNVFNPHFQRQLSIDLDEFALSSAGLFCSNIDIDEEDRGSSSSAPASVISNNRCLATTAWQEKEHLCEKIVASLRVMEGDLCLVDQKEKKQHAQATPTNAAKELSRVQVKLTGIDIEVVFFRLAKAIYPSDTDEDKDVIVIEVTHLIDPLHQRVYTLCPIPAAIWRETGFPDMSWLRPSDHKGLCQRLLRRLVPHQGVPSLQIHGKVFLPVEFEPFEEEHQDSSNNVIIHQPSLSSVKQQQQNKKHKMWRWVCRLRTCQDPTRGTLSWERYWVTARLLGEEGKVKFKAHSASTTRQKQQSSLAITISPSDWHVLAYGPLEWFSPAQQEFLVTLFRDRLEVKDKLLCFSPISILRYSVPTASSAAKSNSSSGSPMVYQVSDYGNHFEVTAGSMRQDGAFTPFSNKPAIYNKTNLASATGWEGINSIHWLKQPLRMYICMRLARLASLATGDSEQGPQIKSLPILIWKGIQRQLRRGKMGGPLLVSVYDVGYGLRFDFRDHVGNRVEEDSLQSTILSHAEYQRMLCEIKVKQQSMSPREDLWLLTTPSAVRETFLYKLIGRVGHQRSSNFPHFLQLRPQSDAERLASIPFDTPKTYALPDDAILQHIQQLCRDPTALMPNEVKVLEKLLQQFKELNMVMDREENERFLEMMMDDSDFSTTRTVTISLGSKGENSTRSSRSLFRRPPKPVPHICECCGLELLRRPHPSPQDQREEGGKRSGGGGGKGRQKQEKPHGAVCSHENRVCRVCMIQRRTSIVRSHTRNMQTCVYNTLRKARPPLLLTAEETGPASADGSDRSQASGRRRSSNITSAGQGDVKRASLNAITHRVTKEPGPELYSAWNHFYIGTMVFDDESSIRSYPFYGGSSSISSHMYHNLGSADNSSGAYDVAALGDSSKADVDAIVSASVADDQGLMEDSSLEGLTTLQLNESMYSTSSAALLEYELAGKEDDLEAPPLEIAVIDTDRRRSSAVPFAPLLRTRLSQDLERATLYQQMEQYQRQQQERQSTGVDSSSHHHHQQHPQGHTAFNTDGIVPPMIMEMVDYECNACGHVFNSSEEPWLACLDCEDFDLCIPCARERGALKHEDSLDVTATAPLTERCGHEPSGHTIGWAT